MVMKPGVKVLMMQRPTEGRERSEYGGGNRRMIGYDRNENMRPRSEYNGGSRNEYGREPRNEYEGGYRSEYEGRYRNENENRYRNENENRYRNEYESRYRNEYEGGMYPGGPSMMIGDYNRGEYAIENRRRRSPRTGRFIRSEYRGMDEEDEEERRSYSPKAYGGSSYGDIYAEGTIYAPGAMNRQQGKSMDKYHSHEIDEEMAMEWVHELKNADGSKGPHYKIDQVEQWRSTNCMDCEKWPFFVTVNMMYSDYCKTAEKMGVSKLDFYGHLAKDFLKDEDAAPDKLYKYKEYIAEK